MSVGTEVVAAAQQAQIDIPKATQGIFELPCGLLTHTGELITEVQVREITGQEEAVLSAKNISGGKKLTQILANCLERLGPMTDKPMLIQAAQSLTVGDRAFLMIAVRRVTFGDSFPYEAKCPSCEEKDWYNIDLSELKVKPMPDPKKRVFDVSLPSGKLARLHVMTGREEENLAKVDTRDKLSAAIWIRLDTLDGNPVTIENVAALSMRDRNFLRDQFDEVEGGIDTNIEIACSNCGSEFETDMDVGQAGFFFPSRIRKNSKRSTSSF